MSSKITMNSDSLSTLTFGGLGGNFSPISNVGGQTIIFKGGDLLDSIQIGKVVYGGGGGSQQGYSVLPADGTFTLKKLYHSNNVISYFEANINGQDIFAGNKSDRDCILELGEGIKVTFAGISSGSAVDSLTLTRVG